MPCSMPAFFLGGSDVWSFSAGAGDALMLRMGAAGLTPRFGLFADRRTGGGGDVSQ